MSSQLTPRAKSIIAAVGAVVLTGITSWQAVTAGGFRLLDVVPVLAAVLGAVQTDLIPNTDAQPVAKAIVHGGFAVASAVSAVIATDPAGFTAAKLLTVASGAFLVWFVGEASPAAALAPVLEQATSGHLDSRDILAALAELDAKATPIADEALAAATAITAPLPAVPASAAPAVTV